MELGKLYKKLAIIVIVKNVLICSLMVIVQKVSCDQVLSTEHRSTKTVKKDATKKKVSLIAKWNVSCTVLQCIIDY